MDNTSTAVDHSKDEVPLTHVNVTNRNSSLFGKIYRIVKQDAEHVVAEIEVEGEKFIHLFSKSEVNAVPDPTKTPVDPVPVAGDTAPVSVNTNPASIPAT